MDEAQELPELFKELRGVIDGDRSQTNRFLLTGSSSKELLSQASDSLAGRVAIVELGALRLTEQYHASPSPFYRIFESALSTETLGFLRTLTPRFSRTEVKQSFLYGGYPEPWVRSAPDFWPVWMENYVQTYVERDVRKLFPKLDLIRYQRFIRMLSSLSGTIINKSDLGRSINTSEVTIRDYLDIAHGT